MVLATNAAFGQAAPETVRPGTPGISSPPIDLYSAALRRNPLDDLELTAVTRMEEKIEAEMKAQADAAAALLRAEFAEPSNRADIAAKVRALADAEMALALARADGFVQLRTELKDLTPAKLQALAMAVESRGTGAPARGRGAPPPPAPAGRGTP